MRRQRVIQFGLGTLIVAAVAVGVVYAVRSQIVPIDVEYPNAPFSPYPKELPRVISVTEEPAREDKAAYAKYQENRKIVRKYLLENGAISRSSPEAREAYTLVVSEKAYVKGREAVNKVLKDDPTSIPARFALAILEHKSDVNFPKALFLVRKLRKELHQKGVENPDDADAREWYLRVLDREYLILSDMSRDEESLRVIDLIEQIYEPLPWRRLWPLMRLKRFDEANAMLEKAGDGKDRVGVLNARMVLEGRQHRRKEGYDAGKAATTLRPDSAVMWKNFSIYCKSNFLPAEGVEALLKSAQCKEIDYNGTPYMDLADHYVSINRKVEAWDALKQAQQLRLAREPYTLVQDQDDFAFTAAVFLASLGRTSDALRFARQMIERPGRDTSMTDERSTTYSHARFLRGLVLARLEEIREEHAADGAAPFTDTKEKAALEVEWRGLERQMLRVLADDEYLVKLMRPYLRGVPSGVPLTLVKILPPGLSSEALRRAREAEDHPGAVPYFDASDAMIAWRRGNLDEARDWAKKALDGLPDPYESGQRAQMSAILGEAARKSGDVPEMKARYDEVLRTAPISLRELSLALPVKLADDGSELADKFARRILSSPRFVEHPDGLPLDLRAADGRLSFTLHLSSGVRHCDGAVPIGDDPDGALSAACRRLHARLFSPDLDLTASDVNSLDTGLFTTPTTSETTKLFGLAGQQKK